MAKFSFALKGLESDRGLIIVSSDLDYHLSPASSLSPSFGFEYWGGRYFALRGGYSVKQTDLSRLVGLATGIGVRWRALRMDYAFAPFSTLGNTHRVTLNWEFWPLVSLPVPGSVVGQRRTPIKGWKFSFLAPYAARADQRPLPPAPPFLNAEVGEGTVLLRWDAPPASGIMGYNVYFKREGEESFRKYTVEPTGSTTIILGGLDANVRYEFIVKTVDDAVPARESAASPPATAIPY